MALQSGRAFRQTSMFPRSIITRKPFCFALILWDMTSIDTAIFGVASEGRASFGLHGSSARSAHSQQRKLSSSFFNTGRRRLSPSPLRTMLMRVVNFGCLNARWKQKSFMRLIDGFQWLRLHWRRRYVISATTGKWLSVRIMCVIVCLIACSSAAALTLVVEFEMMARQSGISVEHSRRWWNRTQICEVSMGGILRPVW